METTQIVHSKDLFNIERTPTSNQIGSGANYPAEWAAHFDYLHFGCCLRLWFASSWCCDGQIATAELRHSSQIFCRTGLCYEIHVARAGYEISIQIRGCIYRWS